MFAYQLKLKDILTVSALIVVLGFLSVGAFQEYQKQQEISHLNDELKLKAPEENIIKYTEYDSSGQPLPAPTNELNGNLIKYVYRTNTVVPEDSYQGLKEDIAQRTPNAQIFLKSEKIIAPEKIEKTYVGKFYSGQQFQKSGDKWYRVRTATTTKSALLKQTKLTILAQAKSLLGQKVFAINGSYDVGSGNGYVTRYNSTVWSTVHDATAGTSVHTDLNLAYAQSGDEGLFGQNDEYEISRAFLPFDTSAIPSSVTNISSASVNIYVFGVSDIPNDPDYSFIAVMQTDQPDSTALTTSDYNNCGATTTASLLDGNIGGLINFGDIVASATNTISLWSGGINWIKKNGETSNCGTISGVTCLGLREGHDVFNQANLDMHIVNFYTTVNGSNIPYLTVTYTVPPPTMAINGANIKVNGGNIKINGAAP